MSDSNYPRMNSAKKKAKKQTLLELGVIVAAALSLHQVNASENFARLTEQITSEESQQLRDLNKLKSETSRADAKAQTVRLVKQALTYSPIIREANFAATASGQDIAAARGARLPQVTATAQSVNSDGEINRASRATGKPALTVTAQMVAYDWGRIAANIEGREYAQTGAYARADLTKRQVVSDTLNNCLELSKQRALVTANVEYIDKINVIVSMLTKVTQADTGRRGELIQARSRLLQAESSRDVLRSKVREVAIRIERSIGAENAGLCTGIGADFIQGLDLTGLRTQLVTHPQIIISETDYQQSLKNIDQVAASRKPQVLLRAEHAPVAVSVTNDYAQTISVLVTAPLYDGNTLKSTERAALERANSAQERIETNLNQLDTELRERAKAADTNFRRAEEYIGLLEINDQVRKDFFTQWAELGRRSLFELLAIEAEQFTLQSGYFTALYDGMIGVANVNASLGKLTVEE